MQARLARSKDFWAGLMFVAFGSMALLVGSDYTIGEARQMGPGYFPMMLGGLLCLFGVVIAARGVAAGAEKFRLGSWRPFLVLLGVLAFALLLERAGLVISTVVLIAIGSLAGGAVRLAELLLLTAVLVLFAVAVFAWGVGLPLPIWPGQ